MYNKKIYKGQSTYYACVHGHTIYIYAKKEKQNIYIFFFFAWA